MYNIVKSVVLLFFFKYAHVLHELVIKKQTIMRELEKREKKEGEKREKEGEEDRERERERERGREREKEKKEREWKEGRSKYYFVHVCVCVCIYIRVCSSLFSPSFFFLDMRLVRCVGVWVGGINIGLLPTLPKLSPLLYKKK